MDGRTDFRVLGYLQSVDPVTGNDRWRIEQPFRALSERGYNAWATDAAHASGYFQGTQPFDAVVLCRTGIKTRAGARQIRRALDTTDTRLVMDYDDRLDIVPPWSEYNQDNPPWAWNRYYLEICDLVTVSTPYLAHWLTHDVQVGCPVAVLPNRVRPGLYKRTCRDRLTLGLIGAATHRYDWVRVREPLGRVLDRHPEVDLLVVGGTIDLRGPNVQHLPAAPWPGYRELMGSVDIGLAPVNPSDFNKGRSCLKWVEWGSVGIPIIASPTVYGDVIFDAIDGLIARTPDEWERCLEALITDEQLRDRIGQAAKRRVAHDWTENDRTCQERWRVYVGEKKWKSGKSSASFSSERQLSLSPS